MVLLLQVFSAILGDPPYGVRAGGRKSVAKEVTVRYRATHIPSTDPYSLTECLADLLELAAVTLVLGGCWHDVSDTTHITVWNSTVQRHADWDA